MQEFSLYELEKDYYLGNYVSCINKASMMETREESIFYLCLSFFHAKKYDLMKSEATRSSAKSVELLDLLLSYTLEAGKRAEIIEELDSIIEDKKLIQSDDVLSRLVISSIYVREKLFGKALKTLHKLDTLPVYLAQIGIYLAMNRTDLAERQLRIMQSKDDYATLTLLALAQVRLVSGNAKEAYDIAKELEDKNRPTPLLYNLQTAAAISMGHYDESKQHCKNALDLDNDNLEALINMLCLLSKEKVLSDVKERHFARLKALYPEHDFVKEVERLEVELVH